MQVGFSYTTDPSKRRWGATFIVSIIVGIIGAFAKWGWEVPFPPRNPHVFWPIGAPERVTPPKVFLDQIGLGHLDWTWHFSGVSLPLDVFTVHVLFSVVFALLYCLLAEYWPRVKMWQGALFGIIVYILAHVIVMPLMGLVPPITQIPFDENFSEFLGHIAWLWVMELCRRDLRNRITGEPDPEKASR